MLTIVLQSLLFTVPMCITGFAHALIIKRNLFAAIAKPIDRGKTFNGKPIFGPNKTWRAIVFFTIFNGLLMGVMGWMIVSNSQSNFTFVDFTQINAVMLGAFIGLLDRLAELPNSFMKRQLSIKSGSSGGRFAFVQYCVDQIDGPIVISGSLFAIGVLSFEKAIVLFCVATFLHALIDHWFFVRKGLKATNQSETPWRRPLTVIVQLFSYPIFRLIFWLLGSKTTTSPVTKDIKSSKFVLYGNHQSVIDPIVVCALLPFKLFVKLLPFRFFVENTYYDNKFLKPFIYLFGGFPAHKHKEGFGVDRAMLLLENHQTVVIFPQGRRTNQHIAYPGVVKISEDSHVMLLPFVLSWRRGRKVNIEYMSPYVADRSKPELVMNPVFIELEKSLKQVQQQH